MIPPFQNISPDNFSGLIRCERGYLQMYETSEKASVAIYVVWHVIGVCITFSFYKSVPAQLVKELWK